MTCLEIECNDDARFNGLEALRDDIKYFDILILKWKAMIQ